MKEVQVKMWDDLAYATDESRVEADETLRLVLGDQITELDLTEANAKVLRELLAPYFEAGTPPEEGLRKPHRAGPPTTTNGVQHVNGQPPEDRQARFRYNAAMRDYADARGIDYRATADRAPYYPATLRAEFAAYMRDGGG